ncbi:MAG: hypothetical protein RIS43_789 [Actinomycetota bacterium]
MAYGARLESVLGASPHGFESHILRKARARRQVIPTRWPKPRQVKLDLRGFSDYRLRSRKALSTTEMLENAIAAPPSIGLSRPMAATGMRITL